MAKDFDKMLQQPGLISGAEFESARREVHAILKGGKELPRDYQILFSYAFRAGVAYARGEQLPLSKQTKTVEISKTQGEKPMVTKQDMEAMRAELARLTEQVNAQLDGTSKLEKMDQAQLVQICRDMSESSSKRNAAADVLLRKCDNDPARFAEIIKGGA
jgi:ElaB/YqjD/DUF883 family membrane-anchored ribosome-binding protein